MTKSTFLRLLFLASAVSVLVLAIIPQPPQALNTGWDKSNHALAFFAITMLGSCAYPKNLTVLLCGLLGFGAVIELLQLSTHARAAELADFFADGVGILVAYLLTAAARRRASLA